MSQYKNILKKRRRYSIGRVEELKEAIRNNSDVPNVPGLCMYLTGSYGRLEASEYSDLDLFFVIDGASDKNQISHVEKSLLDAGIIRTCRSLKFPEFSKGGIYLQIHYLTDILDNLGSPRDDYKNYFTARMLLVLESIPLTNIETYNAIIQKTINTYYRDYHDHEKDFLPVFLVNDIRRFWMTMCLNFEHSRNRRGDMDAMQKNRVHIKNMKLKFSRLLTCYSMIAAIMQKSDTITQNNISLMVHDSPLERIESLVNTNPSLDHVIQNMLQDYAWFLEKNGHPESKMLEWMAEKNARNIAFERAREFGKNMYKILLSISDTSDKLRYLIV